MFATIGSYISFWDTGFKHPGLLTKVLIVFINAFTLWGLAFFSMVFRTLMHHVLIS